MAGQPWLKYQGGQAGGIYQLPPTAQESAQTASTLAGISNDSARLQLERERLRLAQQEAETTRRNAEAQAQLHEYDLEDRRRTEEAKNPFNPTALSGIQQDAMSKLRTVERIVQQHDKAWLPTVGFGSASTAQKLPGSNAANLRVSMGELSQAGALRAIMDMAAQNGGKNPLTPMSNSDVNLVANTVSGIDPNQQSSPEFFKSLKPYVDAYTRAYAGATGMRGLGDAIEFQVNKWRSENPGATMAQERVFRETLTRNAKADYDRRMADMNTGGNPRLRPPPSRAKASDPGWWSANPYKAGNGPTVSNW